MRRSVKWLLILVVTAVGISALSYPAVSWWQQRSMPKYLSVTISRGRVETVVNSTGTVKPVRTVSVGAFTSGPIKKIFVDFNDEITEKDMVMALIEDKLQAAAVARDEATVATQVAELARINALLEQAGRSMGRANNLRNVNPKYISATEMDQFQFSIKTLAAQRNLTEALIQQAEATLLNSRAQLNYTKIRGPKEIDPTTGVKGKVIERKVDEGQTVAASFQTPELFTVALEMDKHMYVYASVDEADIGLIRGAEERKQAVEFTVEAYRGELFTGKIHEIRLNSTTTQNVVTYPVIIDAANLGQKLKPGMTANITFQILAKENVLRVPSAALRFTPLSAQVYPEDRHYLEAATTGQNLSGAKRKAGDKAGMAQSRARRIVWVQDGPLLRAVPITLGLAEYQFAEVLQGDLSEGQAVVTGTEGLVTVR